MKESPHPKKPTTFNCNKIRKKPDEPSQLKTARRSRSFACEWGSYLCPENCPGFQDFSSPSPPGCLSCPWIPGFLVAVAARVPKLSLDSRISRRRRRQGAQARVPRIYYAICALLYMLCYPYYAIYAMVSLLCYLCYAIFDMLSLLCGLRYLCYAVFALLSVLCGLCYAVFPKNPGIQGYLC